MKKKVFTGVLLTLAVLIVISLRVPLPRETKVTVLLERHPEEIWTIINEVHNYKDWWPQAWLAEKDGEDSWVVELEGQKWPIKIVEYVRPTRLVMNVPDPLSLKATWTFQLEPDAEGTKLTLIESISLRSAFYRIGRRALGENSHLEDFAHQLTTLTKITKEPATSSPSKQ